MSNERFTGTHQHVASDDLIARSPARPLDEWHIKSTSEAQQGRASRASSWVNGCLP
ncbi:MAG TPA: hypothetical protein VMO54_09435 [Steroidobacteraceae bacterium]|nr:hypothetical protein [Steroidobacteraceae bacterium]